MPYHFTPVPDGQLLPWSSPERRRVRREGDRFKAVDAAHWPTGLKYAAARNLDRMGCQSPWIEALRAMTPAELLALQWIGRRRLPALLALLDPQLPAWTAEE